MNYFGEIRKPCKYSLDWFEKNYFVDFTRNILVYKSGGSIVRRLIILSLCLFEENPDFNHTIFDFKRYCYQKPSKQQWLDYCLSQKEFRGLPLTEIHQLWLKSNYLDFLTFISSESHAEYLEAFLDEIKALNQQEKDYLLFFFYKNIDYILDKTPPNPKKAKKEKIFEPDLSDDEISSLNLISITEVVSPSGTSTTEQLLVLMANNHENNNYHQSIDDLDEKYDDIPPNLVELESLNSILNDDSLDDIDIDSIEVNTDDLEAYDDADLEFLNHNNIKWRTNQKNTNEYDTDDLDVPEPDEIDWNASELELEDFDLGDYDCNDV